MGIAIANRKNRCDFGALSLAPREAQENIRLNAGVLPLKALNRHLGPT